MPRGLALQDPALAEDKLPQPFRTIDKLLNELIGAATRSCEARDEVLRLQQELEQLPAAECCSRSTAQQHVACCSLTDEHCFLLRDGGSVDVLEVQQGQLVVTINSSPGSQCMAAYQHGTQSLVALASATSVELHTADLSQPEGSASSEQPAPQVPLAEQQRRALVFSPGGALLALCSDRSLALLHVGGSPTSPTLQPLQEQLEVGPPAGSSEEADSCVEVAWHWAERAIGATTKQQVYGIYCWKQGSSQLQLWAISGSASEPSVSPSPSGTWRLPGNVTTSCQARDGSLLALGMAHGAVLLWDCGLGIPVALVQVATCGVACAAFTHDGTQLVSATCDGGIHTTDTSGKYTTRRLVKHFMPPKHIFQPSCLDQRMVLVGARPWESVPTNAGALVYDLKQGTCVGKLALHAAVEAAQARPQDGAEVAKESGSTPPQHGSSSDPLVECCGSMLLQVHTEATAEGTVSCIELVDLQDAAGHGQPAVASTGALNVQRFLDDMPDNGQQQSRSLQRVASFASDDGTPFHPQVSLRRDSYASSATGSTGGPEGDRASMAAAPVRVNPLPADVLEVGAMQHIMEAVALRCGGRRRRERKVRRTMAAMAAELAKQSDYKRTGLGLVAAQ